MQQGMTKRAALMMATAALVAGNSGSALAATDPVVTAEIRRVEDVWINAMITADIATLERVLHPGYIGMSPLGKIDTRGSVIAAVRDGIWTHDPTMAGLGGLAEVNVVMYDTDTAVAYGPMKDGKHQYNDVFIKENGEWRAVFSQVSLIPTRAKQ